MVTSTMGDVQPSKQLESMLKISVFLTKNRIVPIDPFSTDKNIPKQNLDS